ncbi:MAG TPA: acyl-CoA dehydrogenase [Longimicrobiales bacterium]
MKKKGAPKATAVTRSPLAPALLPFAPMLYIAWADGTLTPAEIADIRARVAGDATLDADVRAGLSTWLDPDAPPSPEDLRALLALIRTSAADLDEDARASLTALGQSLAESGRSGPARASARSALQQSLQELEDALGVAGGEAARSLFPHDDSPRTAKKARKTSPEKKPDGDRGSVTAFDPAALLQFLDGDHAEVRRRVLNRLSEPRFAYLVDPTRAEYRQQVFEWLEVLAADGFGALAFPEEFGGAGDATQMIAVFETLAYHDLSLLIKFGVHFGLFGGSVYLLGTRHHHERYLRDIATLALPGCFAMTETGHGSNVRDLRTTATYDASAGEFVIHTPDDSARKDYIGNAAQHARMAVVFAQLIVGGTSHGVHALMVPLRDAGGNTLKGIRIEDCGLKEGLNGVDNGRIWFDQVRVPRENLLNRFADVTENGTYTSPITSPARRFFTMLGTLVAGRVSIAGASVSAAKSGLTIAVRYTNQRRQFGPEGGEEQPVLDYLAVQRRLLPALAATIALDCAMTDLVRRFGERTDENARELEALVAGMKAVSSQHAVDTLAAARQACGGAGYFEVNRISRLLGDTDVFTTFEGANDVLLQLVARGMLTEYKEQFGDMNVWSAVRWVGRRAAATIADLNPVTPRRTDAEHLRDPDFHRDAFRYREDRLLQSLARRLRQRIQDGQDSFDALNECQDHALAAARAWVERYVLECMHTRIRDVRDPALRALLERIAALHALSRIEQDAGWFLEAGFLEAPKSKAIRAVVNSLCSELRPAAAGIVAGFGIPDPLLSAPIGVQTEVL